jgi:hypothetical protein
MGARHAERMATLADAPPARRVETPAEAPLPKTDPEVIRELVKLGFETGAISKAADLRLMLLTAIRDLAAQSSELARHRRALDRVQAEVPDLIVKHAATLAASMAPPPELPRPQPDRGKYAKRW